MTNLHFVPFLLAGIVDSVKVNFESENVVNKLL
jgi:hypothetical protein